MCINEIKVVNLPNNDKLKKYSNVIRSKDQSGQSPKRIVAKAIGFGFEYRCPYV